MVCAGGQDFEVDGSVNKSTSTYISWMLVPHLYDAVSTNDGWSNQGIGQW